MEILAFYMQTGQQCLYYTETPLTPVYHSVILTEVNSSSGSWRTEIMLTIHVNAKRTITWFFRKRRNAGEVEPLQDRVAATESYQYDFF
jgi:hypothetical protein